MTFDKANKLLLMYPVSLLTLLLSSLLTLSLPAKSTKFKRLYLLYTVLLSLSCVEVSKNS